MTDNLTGFQRFVPASLLALTAVLCASWLGACSLQEPPVQEPAQEPLEQISSQIPVEIDNPVDTKDSDGTPEGPVSVKNRLSATSVETVGSIEYDGTAVNATVISTGCTTSEHFTVEHAQDADTCHVVLVRNKPDFCRRAPFVATVSVPWEAPASCASQSVVFDNPVVDLKGSSSRKLTQ